MTVFRLDPDSDHFHNFALVDESDATIYRQFDGTPFGAKWHPLTIMAVDTDDELAILGDHALLGTMSFPRFDGRGVYAARATGWPSCRSYCAGLM